MELSVSFTTPSTVLRALTAASHLMANHDEDLKEAIDALIRATAFFIDEQSKEAEDRERKRREKAQEEHEATGPSAIEDARKVAKILIERGGDAARVALGLPPPDPLEQQRIRARFAELYRLHPEWAVDPERAATGLNSVILEIDDDADHGVSGRHYWVSANIYLPTDCNPATDPLSRPFGQS
jgi:hypothetical protein